MAGGPLAQGWCDSEDRLVRADPPLADLQISCGGSIPGVIAIPALREVVAKARRFGLKLARPIAAQDGEQAVRLWVEVTPARAVQAGDDNHPADCLIAVLSWHTQPLPFESDEAAGQRRIEIDRALAEGVGRLDARQGLLDFASDAPDLAALTQAMRGGLGRPWTDFVTLPGNSHRQPIHWRLLDGANVACPGSARAWRATLVPQPAGGGDPVGFELLLTSDAPLAVATQTASEERMIVPAIVGREVAPVLRLPLARIIANAETIRARLEGPLDEEYSQYAADIAGAAQHLLGLVDDLADLEVIEAADFTTAPDHIDLADVARRAGGILGVKARARRIVLDLPPPGAELAAVGRVPPRSASAAQFDRQCDSLFARTIADRRGAGACRRAGGRASADHDR